MILTAIAGAEIREDVALVAGQHAHVSKVRRESAVRGEKICSTSLSARFEARELYVGIVAGSLAQPSVSATCALPGSWQAPRPMPNPVQVVL